MSERHVVLRVGRGDKYAPTDVPRSRVVFTVAGRGDNPKTDIQEKHLWSRLAELGLQPPQVAVDLYRICAAAYCADLRLPRSGAYDNWTRQIVLHAPVADPELWSPCVETLAELLGFLSGDVWRIELREGDVPAPSLRPRRRKKSRGEEEKPEPLDAVCLFSGGLDSFIGGADAIAAGRNLLLVSHVPEGVSRFLSPAQDALRKGLAGNNPERRLEHLKVTLNPPPETEKTGKEPTQRVRSVLFLGLGTLAAASIRDSTPLIVPENGFISLNLPLTPGRIGSLSTRTTHPYAIQLYRTLLQRLAINVLVELPYMFQTKGEMLAGAAQPKVVQSLADKSVSCANPNPRSSAREAHCGYCVPCILRRSAMERAGQDDPKRYRLDIRRPGRKLTNAEASHLIGFKIAIRRRVGGVSTAELLAGGPVPEAMGDISDFRAVHDRGLAEVAAFLNENV